MRSDKDDPAYQAGWLHGRQDTLNNLFASLQRFKQAQERLGQEQERVDHEKRDVHEILRDADLIMAEMVKDPAVDSAVTLAVLAGLMAKSGVTPEDLEKEPEAE